jgi:pimeloyl-ACP methyl ester carboxylesterase
LESSDLSIDDDFFDKGGDSLLATELMLELRQLTGKALPDSMLFESSTVRALAQRLSEKETPRPNVAVRVGAASDGAKPLLFFHGDWSWGGFYVEHLARRLGPEISVIAVAPHGPGGEPIPLSIEAMAADRLPAILAAQPTGPYRLAGHCVGGIVALETARLLIRLNHRVETVVMIDSPVMVAGEASKSPQLATGGGDPRAHDLVAAPDDIPVRPATPFGPAFERYTESLVGYSPTALPVRLLVFAAEYDGRDWLRLSGEAELLEIPGDHFDLVTVRINDLANNLRSWLSGNRQEPSRKERPQSGLESNAAGERNPLTRTKKVETSPANRESRESFAWEHDHKVLKTDMSSTEIPAPLTGRTNYEFLSRPLRRVFNYLCR